MFAQAQATKPAVILLDVQMPDQDGFTTARQLKGHPETAGIPLMFLTGRSTVDDRLAGLRIGADDYVSKSVDPRELVLRVQKLCDRVPAPVAPAPAGAEPEAPAAPPAGPTLVVSRPPDRPWLTREAFRDRVRDLLIRTWGALVLVRAASDTVSVGHWLAEQLRRRDLVGETDGGEWALFLPEETSSGLAPRLTDLLDRLKLTIAAPGRGRPGRDRRRPAPPSRRCSSRPTRRWRTPARAASCWSSSRTRARPARRRWCCSPTTTPR